MAQNEKLNELASVVIVAAGKSSRMQNNVSKQFMEIKSIPVIARTIQVFESSKFVGEIIVVVNKDDISLCEKIIKPFNFYKVKSIVEGGSQRQSSVYKGIQNTSKNYEIVVVHDGARPFVTVSIVNDTIQDALEHDSSICAVRVKDTIKSVSEDGFVQQTLDRDAMWAVQTPQAFKRDIIIKAHQKALIDNFLGTDDAVLVERLGIKSNVVLGDYFNIKITTREDLIFAQAIIQEMDDRNNLPV